MADYPDQIHFQAKVGSVAVFNGSVWHRSYRSSSERPRPHTLPCAFIARERPQQTEKRQYLRPRRRRASHP